MLAEPDRAAKRNVKSADDIRAWIVAELRRGLKDERAPLDSAAPLYSLGIDSMVAVVTTGALSQWLERDLPATLMWDHPSIDAIAEALSDATSGAEKASRPPGVVDLQPEGDRLPLFFFPGAGGHSTTFAPLAASLAPHHPCFGLTVPGLNGEHAPLEHIEEIAAAMVRKVRIVQAQGPYQFAGYSVGGLLAYEAARQLTASGETVSLLAMYDTYAPGNFVLRPRWQRLIIHVYVLIARRGRLEYLRHQAKKRSSARRGSAETSGGGIAKAIEIANIRAAEHYEPQPYPGSILLFRARQRLLDGPLYRGDRSTNGWSVFSDKRIQVSDLPGSHLSMLDVENAARAAALLRIHLAQGAR